MTIELTSIWVNQSPGSYWDLGIELSNGRIHIVGLVDPASLDEVAGALEKLAAELRQGRNFLRGDGGEG